MEKVTLISNEKIETIQVLKVLKEYYLKKGFKEIKKENFFIKLQIKFSKFFFILKRINFSLKKPPKKKFVLYDTSNSETLSFVLPSKDTFLLPVRILEFNKIYISLNLIHYLILNFFKNSIKQNYIAFLIKKISPDIVFTAVEQSPDFYITAKILNKDRFRFIAIQHSCLRSCEYMQKSLYNKTILFQNFTVLVFTKKIF